MRTLVRWRPSAGFPVRHVNFDRLFDRFFEDGFRSPTCERGVYPRVEVFTRDDDLVLRADLPGIDPKELELSVEGDQLTIKGERKTAREGDALYREVSYGQFERTIKLPDNVDPDTVQATYRDGVLEVTLKAPKTLVAKKVPITVH